VKKNGTRLPRFAALLILIMPPSFAFAQEADELINSGIEYHDEGEYEKAIECYEKALKLDPDNPLIYYELAFSHLYNENPEEALNYSQKGIDISIARNSLNFLGNLYDMKGSALDDLGRGEEAVEVYLEALNRFGSNDTHIYYNLGLTYYRMGERDKARNALALNLMEDTFHPSSNFLLGKICYEQGRETQSLYSLCYFLLLEPNSERSEEAWETVEQLVTSPEQIEFTGEGSFSASDLMLSLMFSKNSDESLGAEEQLIQKLGGFFGAMGEIMDRAQSDEITDDLWWEFYVPFFSRLAGSGHFETFCRYISITSSAESGNWLNKNSAKLDALFEWLNSGE
jgi:tetratricopeptide (TPR) repeat protein